MTRPSARKLTPLVILLAVVIAFLGGNAGVALVNYDQLRRSTVMDFKHKEDVFVELGEKHLQLRLSLLDFIISTKPHQAATIKHSFDDLTKVVSIVVDQNHLEKLSLTQDEVERFESYISMLNRTGLVLQGTNVLTSFAATSMQEQINNFAPLMETIHKKHHLFLEQELGDEHSVIQQSYWYLWVSILALGTSIIVMLIMIFQSVRKNDHLLDEIEIAKNSLSQTIESISEGIALFDEDDKLVLCNQVYSKFFNLPDNAIGMTFREMCINTIDQEAYKGLVGNKTDWVSKRISDRASEVTVEYQLENGTWISANDRKTIMGGMVGIRSDITERVNVEQKLRDALVASQAATKAKSEFLAIMSHEIRTPLNGVTGLLGLLLETKLDPEQRGYVMTARESGELLLSVIEDILDFSKIEAEKLELEDSEFNPADIVQHVAELLAPRAHEKAIDIACFIDPSLPETLRGDQARLRQILLNLAGNAVKFTAHGGVTIELAMVAGGNEEITLSGSVTDTGIGIPYDKQDSLFDEFNQLDASYSRRFGGTGLGLAITRRLTEAMNGTISVNSEPERGSTFSFTIQLRKSDNETRSQQAQFKPIAVRTILFWEQQTATSHVLARQIRADGHTVISVRTENDALAQLKTNPVDMVIIDSRPRDETGPILATRLRERSNDVPILLLEATGGVSNDADVVKNGTVNAILYKPVKLRDLRAFLDNPNSKHLSEQATQKQNSRYKNIGVGKRILLAEDSQTNRLVAAAILRRAGYRVDWVADGMEAVESVKRLPYDLVLMDVSMPNMDGLEATAAIRALPGDERDVPIIALTAHAMPGDREKFLASGMDAYLTKPLHTEDMLDAISNYCPSNKYEVDEVENEMRENSFIDAKTDESKAILGADILDENIIAQLRIDAGEEALHSLLGVFLSELSERITAIASHHQNNDIDAIAKEAHALKSSSGSFGAIQMQLLATEIEKYAKSRDADSLAPYLLKLTPLGEATIKAYKGSLSISPKP